MSSNYDLFVDINYSEIFNDEEGMIIPLQNGSHDAIAHSSLNPLSFPSLPAVDVDFSSNHHQHQQQIKPTSQKTNTNDQLPLLFNFDFADMVSPAFKPAENYIFHAPASHVFPYQSMNTDNNNNINSNHLPISSITSPTGPIASTPIIGATTPQAIKQTLIKPTTSSSAPINKKRARASMKYDDDDSSFTLQPKKTSSSKLLQQQDNQDRPKTSSTNSNSNSNKASEFTRGTWSSIEDAMLRSLVNNAGTTLSWTDIASKMKTRSAKQCRERWTLSLNPTINHEPFTPQEDAILLDAHAKLGPRWTKIKTLLPGRTENSVKTRYKSLMRKYGKPLSPNSSDASSP